MWGAKARVRLSILMSEGVTQQASWAEPYLETCCRSALHRLLLSDAAGRPDGLTVGPCLARLAEMGLAERFGSLASERRYRITPAGLSRHVQEIGPAPAE
jgi:hypothetical protein